MILYTLNYLFFVSLAFSQGYVSGVFTNGNATLTALNINPYGTIYRQNFNFNAGSYTDILPSRTTLITAYGGSTTYPVTFINLRIVSNFLTTADTSATIDTLNVLNVSAYEIPPQSKVLINVAIRAVGSVSYYITPITSQ